MNTNNFMIKFSCREDWPEQAKLASLRRNCREGTVKLKQARKSALTAFSS